MVFAAGVNAFEAEDEVVEQVKGDTVVEAFSGESIDECGKGFTFAEF